MTFLSLRQCCRDFHHAQLPFETTIAHVSIHEIARHLPRCQERVGDAHQTLYDGREGKGA